MGRRPVDPVIDLLYWISDRCGAWTILVLGLLAWLPILLLAWVISLVI